MKLIDNFLDKITMYRLVLYFLLLLLGVGVIYSVAGVLSFNPYGLIFSTLFLVAVCWITNKIFAYVYAAPTNVESVYITALILALIVSPARTFHEALLLFWVGVLAMASKYILALNNKHLFNPAALAVTVTAFASVGSASWWVGTQAMLPFVLLGFFIVRKIRRYDLVVAFFFASVTTIFMFNFFRSSNIVTTMQQILFGSSLFFFTFIMLTEPLTTPPTKKLQILYGLLVGILFSPQIHLGNIYTTPELALVVGNIFSYLVSPKDKLVLRLKAKLATGTDLVDFVFSPRKKLAFNPGQYMEWTLQHPQTDSRGNRRYFTIASSPTEDTLRLGIRFYPKGSSFKKAMIAMDEKMPFVGASLGGDFTLPKDQAKKLVFIAGGIGVTPFRSMLKYLVDTKQPRPIVFFYANKSADEIVYTEVFNQAQQELGIKTVYTLTDHTKVPHEWSGHVGRINAALIAQEVPDFKERTFYLSGPHAMVVSYEEVLRGMGVSSAQIKKDFFPGYV